MGELAAQVGISEFSNCKTWHEKTCEFVARPNATNVFVFVPIFAAGKLGIKSGEGFYSWTHGTKELIVADNFKK